MLHILALIAGSFLAFYLLFCIALLIISYKALIAKFKEENKRLTWLLWIEYFFSTPAIFIAITLKNFKKDKK